MAQVLSFHWLFEARKPPAMRIYHSNEDCSIAQLIPRRERLLGSADIASCYECDRLNRKEPKPWH